MFKVVYFCGSVIFCVSQELLFVIRTDLFFLLGINFGDFQKVPSQPRDKGPLVKTLSDRNVSDIIRKNFELSTGFKPMVSVLALRCSTN